MSSKKTKNYSALKAFFSSFFSPQVPPPVVRKKVPEPEEDRSSPVLQPDQSMDGVVKMEETLAA
jgi:hypothetical protein